MKKLFIVTLILMLFSFKHPFYISVTEIKYNAKEQSLQGSAKLFVNDFEDALEKLEKKRIDLIHLKDTVATGKIVNDYFKKRFFITVNDKKIEYQVLGFEHEMDAVWVYFECKSPLPKKIQVENSILYDFIKDQTNIVHIEVNDVKKSSKSNFPDRQLIFEF